VTILPSWIPQRPDKFDGPVAWLLGRQLIASLKSITLYALFTGKLDSRDWMNPQVISFDPKCPNKAYLKKDGCHPAQTENEFWFDFMADTGDGQAAVYSIAYTVMSDLYIHGPSVKETIVSFESSSNKLPVGAFLFVGGDTAYHMADYQTLADRFQAPFCWAFEDLAHAGKVDKDPKKRRPIFGIPGNHDYYDSLDGFNRQFRAPVTGEDVAPNQRGPLLSLPSFERVQQASYVAIELPFGWWFWGLDTENGELDFRQQQFFQSIPRNPDKLVVATSKPTTVFGAYCKPDDPLSLEFEMLGLKRPFLETPEKLDPGKCRLDLAGDVHHYARYWGPDSKPSEDAPFDDHYASVVSGAGGAFLHPSNTDMNDVKPQSLYPSPTDSRKAIAEKIFNVWKILGGGYFWILGSFIGMVVYAGALNQESKPAVERIFSLFAKLVQQFSYTLGLSAQNPDFHVSWQTFRAIAFLVISVVAMIWLIGHSVQMFKKAKAALEEARKRSADQKREGSLTSLLRFLIKTGDGRMFIVLLLLAVMLSLSSFNWFAKRSYLITPFQASMLLGSAFIWVAVVFVEIALYCQWLFSFSYVQTIRSYDYLPVGVLATVAAVVASISYLTFGDAVNAGDLLLHILFLFVLLFIFAGLILLAVFVGGRLYGTTGRILFGALGFWHALLQLVIPFWLVSRGGFKTIVYVPLLLVAMAYFGQMLVNRGRKFRVALLFSWILLGLLLLYIPSQDNAAWVPMACGCLEKNRIVASELCIIPAAGVVSALMSAVLLGWYLAVAFEFNGHNNEVGGAARVEKYKQFIRIKITEKELTAYVIGFDEPQQCGSRLKLKLIDCFRIAP